MKFNLMLLATIFLSFLAYANADDAVCAGYVKVTCGAGMQPFLGQPGLRGKPGVDGSTGTPSCHEKVKALESLLKKTKAVVANILKKANGDYDEIARCKFPKYRYRLIAEKKNFFRARGHCQTLNGDLMHQTGKTAIERLNIIRSLGGNPNNKYWFGIRDKGKINQWKYLDETPVHMAEVGFAAVEPNGGRGIECATMGYEGRLQDWSCNGQQSFICEIKRC